jgi:hypothetical protein
VDVEDRPSGQTPLQQVRVEGVQVARGESLEGDTAKGRSKVNLNLGFMLGPGARPDLRSKARQPVLAEE